MSSYMRHQKIETDVYETRDDINNLRFSVAVRTLGGTTTGLSAVGDGPGDQTDFHSVLGWQQKVEPLPASTAWANPVTTPPLFTYTDVDDYTRRRVLAEPAVAGPKSTVARDVLEGRRTWHSVVKFETMYVMLTLPSRRGADHDFPDGNDHENDNDDATDQTGKKGQQKRRGSRSRLRSTSRFDKDQDALCVCQIRAFADGSFQMTPGFSKAGSWYRIETDQGHVYEIRIENRSSELPSVMQRRQEQLAIDLQTRALRIKQGQLGIGAFEPLHKDPRSHTRALVLLEIVAARGFTGKRLYVNYDLEVDTETWAIDKSTGNGDQFESGANAAPVHPREWSGATPERNSRSASTSTSTSTSSSLRASTQVSGVITYPEDVLAGVPAGHVAHFACPLEVLLESPRRPSPDQFPTLYMHVCSVDEMGRYRTEGYAMLKVDGRPGTKVEYVQAWRPMPTPSQRTEEYYVGGSLELEDMRSQGVPTDFVGSSLNKFGFRTETTGSIKIRSHVVVQQRQTKREKARLTDGRQVLREAAAIPELDRYVVVWRIYGSGDGRVIVGVVVVVLVVITIRVGVVVVVVGEAHLHTSHREFPFSVTFAVPSVRRVARASTTSWSAPASACSWPRAPTSP